MSSIRNRELSQFGSFIHINDSTQEIGITTSQFPYVGIGKTNPQFKLDVLGNINAESFTINGDPLVSASIDRWSSGTGNDIYRLFGNVGIGTTIVSQKLTVIGNVSAGQFISTIQTGTAPFTVQSETVVQNLNAFYLRGGAPGGTAKSEDIVTVGAAQTLSSKSLLSPIITSIQVGVGNTQTLPTGIGSIISTNSVGLVTSGMIANNTISNGDIATGAGITYGKLSLNNSILNSDIAVGAGITYGKLNLSNSIIGSDFKDGSISNAKLQNFSISGVSLGSSLGTLSFGTYIQVTGGTSYNGSTNISIGISASNANNSGTIVVRDSSGNFSAGTITANLTGTATTATTATTAITATTATTAGYATTAGISTTATTAGYATTSGISTVSQGLTGSPNINVGIITGTSVNDSNGNVRAIPQNTQSISYTLTKSDVGKHINAGNNITVLSNIFTSGDAITIYNNSATNRTITQGIGVTLRFSGTTTTGSRTILPYGIANILCVNTTGTEFVVTGIII